MKVNDILVSKWGYEAVNVDFYRVVAVTPKSVRFVSLGKKTVKRGSSFEQGEYVMPDVGVAGSVVHQKKLKVAADGTELITISSFQRAYVWNGNAVHEYNWH